MKKSNSGFTLIELIVVIVILGILAVTAAPKFIDLQSDARSATINGVRAAINSAVSLVHGKALVSGVDKTAWNSSTPPKVKINGSDVEVNYGYPRATIGGIADVTDLDIDTAACSPTTTTEWCGKEDGDVVTIFIGNHYANNATSSADPECYVKYTQATKSGDNIVAPKVEVKTNGC